MQKSTIASTAKTEKVNCYAPALSNWLFITAAAVFAMIIIGAITRLTESGLSMVEWRPLIGGIPPLNDDEWRRVFTLYQQTPEFQKKNFWMDLPEFKNIFFWEWLHRLWGRMIGLIYALPLLWFWVRGAVPQPLKLPLLGLLFLGGLQAVIGWVMVQSGLVDRPSVSHYRLALHLGVAFLILCLLIWYGMKARMSAQRPNAVLYAHGWAALGILIITIFWGAYVAGLDAGMIYNEFPMMGGSFAPPEMWHLNPAFINFFENRPAVQFTHRWLGILTGIALLSFVAHAFIKHYTSVRYGILGVLVFVQIGLGISTLLTQVYLPLAVMHQAGATLLLITLIACLYHTKPQPRR